jgi:hypothetical protein
MLSLATTSPFSTRGLIQLFVSRHRTRGYGCFIPFLSADGWPDARSSLRHALANFPLFHLTPPFSANATLSVSKQLLRNCPASRGRARVISNKSTIVSPLMCCVFKLRTPHPEPLQQQIHLPTNTQCPSTSKKTPWLPASISIPPPTRSS